VVLGHIDHGKTSILDYIKKSHVQEKEEGGITQHIGAYEIGEGDKKITFIDTPGHEAFSAIRSRGAKVADIAILVIDAVDGVKAQTKEAISHIKESGISLVVAFNKIDKFGADPDKVKQDLIKQDITVEDLGGKVPSVSVSAKTGQGIPDLLDLILLVAEMEDLKADFSGLAKGVVIEAFLDSKKGPVATILLSKGILKGGDIVATPSTFGKIKKLEDFQGKEISKAEPCCPAILLGLNQAPKVGEEIQVFKDLETAKSHLKEKEKQELKESPEISAEQKVLNLIIKADVEGSIEAIEQMFKALPQDKVVLRVLKSGIGEINENDFKLAKSFKALIIGFRVKMSQTAEILSKREKTKVIKAEIIYELVEQIRAMMERRLTSKTIRTDLGKVKVLVIFMTEKSRQIVGGKIVEGEVQKGAKIEVYREEELIGKGKIINLQRNKKDIAKLAKGEECGILYDGNGRIDKGDILVIYRQQRRKEEL